MEQLDRFGNPIIRIDEGVEGDWIKRGRLDLQVDGEMVTDAKALLRWIAVHEMTVEEFMATDLYKLALPRNPWMHEIEDYATRKQP